MTARKARAILYDIVIVSLMFSPGACQMHDQTIVQAQRMTFDAVAPEWEAYFMADPALSAEEKARRQRLKESWELRIAAQEEAGK